MARPAIVRRPQCVAARAKTVISLRRSPRFGAVSKHPLAIELLEHAGKAEAFTADANVKIADRRSHTVLNAKAGGPFMLVDLPPERYSIIATLKHASLRKSAAVVTHDRLAGATFEFPAHTD